MIETFQLQTHQSGDRLVLVPEGFASTKTVEYISFGSKKLPCQLVSMSAIQNEISISTSLAEQLCIPFGGNISPYIHENTIYLTPLIGIFTAGFTESLLRPIGDRSMLFANLIASNSNHNNFIFVFGTHCIDWESEMIYGYFFTSERWVRYTVPFPTVIYNRLPNRKSEKHQHVKSVKQRLQSEYQIPCFNPGFFNKWDVYLQLTQSSEVRHYLPKTVKFKNFDDIEQFLSDFQYIYMKPENGSLGSRVTLIRYSREEESYYCRYRENGTNRLKKFSTLESLISHVFKGHRLEDFIIQQGISLLRHKQKPLDFRVHANKNGNGIWEVTAIAAKVAGKGSTTTHLNNGGEVKMLDELFEKQMAEDFRNKLSNAALQISKVLDEKIEGHIGEIGFDLGIDQNEKVWLFEANSKPGRSIFSHPELKKIDSHMKHLFLQYATHLAKTNLTEVVLK